MSSRNSLILTGACALLFVAVTLWIVPSSTDFSESNPYWNGLQQASRQFAITWLPRLDLIPRQARGTALVVIPAVLPSAVDLQVLKQYTESGGTLILLDDFGFSGVILAQLGIRARLGESVLVDHLFNFRNRRLPRIIEFTGNPASEGVESLVFNHATVITETGGLGVVAKSSPVSFLDLNGNGRRDPNEPRGPFAVAALGRVGEGRLVLVSDSSILLNSMLELGDNRRFVQNLFQLAGANGRIYLDEAHLPKAPLDVAKFELARLRGLIATPLVTFAALSIGLAVMLAKDRRSTVRTL